MEFQDKPLSYVSWQCRRGMLELDVFFQRYFTNRYPSAPLEEKSLFHRLLDCEDQAIWMWILGHGDPPPADLSIIIDIMLNTKSHLNETNI